MPWTPPQKPQKSSDHIRCRNSQLFALWENNKTKARTSSSIHRYLIKKVLPVFKSTVNSDWDIYTGFTLKKWYEMKSEDVCRWICAYILKTIQKDLVWFHVYLILPNLAFNYCYSINMKRWGVGFVHCPQVPFTLPAPGWVSVVENSAYLLSLVPLLGLRQILCLGWQVLGLRLLVVVRLLALLAVATYTLLTILRWDLLEEPSKANTWVEAERHEIKLCPTHMATSAEVISSATHLTQWSDSFTQQLMGALRSSCLSRSSKPKYPA